MSNLVETAIAVILAIPGNTARSATTQLFESINADLGTHYTVDYISKWRRGERSIPQPVQDWLLRMCVSHAIDVCGGRSPVADEQIDRLAAMLCPPHRGK